MLKTTISLTAAALSLFTVTVTAPVYAQNAPSAPQISGATAQTQPGKDAVLVTTGKFRSVAHSTKGVATIFENKDGSRSLKITGFSTAEGPAVHVLLIADGDAKDNASVKKAGYIDLGKLKGRKGDQSYAVPKDIDLWKYRAVTIWCDKFDVNFGTAPLAAKQ